MTLKYEVWLYASDEDFEPSEVSEQFNRFTDAYKHAISTYPEAVRDRNLLFIEVYAYSSTRRNEDGAVLLYHEGWTVT